MGANDDITSGNEGGGAATNSSTTSPSSATPAADPALVSRAVQAELSKFSGQFDGKLNDMGKAIGQYVQQALQGAQQRVAAGTGTNEDADLAQKLISDPRATVESLIDGRLQAQLAPWISGKVESDFQDNLDRQAKLIDDRWGPGSFDELIRGAVEETAKQTPNKSALSDRKYAASLVQMTVGQPDVLDKLTERRAKWEADKAAKDKDTDVANEGTGVLGPGRQRARTGQTYTDEERAFMQEAAGIIGEDIDMKKLEEVTKTRRKHGFLDTQTMPGVKNKLAVKGAKHRNSASAT